MAKPGSLIGGSGSYNNAFIGDVISKRTPIFNYCPGTISFILSIIARPGN